MSVMCRGTGCPVKVACARYTEECKGGESYMQEVPYANGLCPSYVKGKPKKKKPLSDV